MACLHSTWLLGCQFTTIASSDDAGHQHHYVQGSKKLHLVWVINRSLLQATSLEQPASLYLHDTKLTHLELLQLLKMQLFCWGLQRLLTLVFTVRYTCSYLLTYIWSYVCVNAPSGWLIIVSLDSLYPRSRDNTGRWVMLHSCCKCFSSCCSISLPVIGLFTVLLQGSSDITTHTHTQTNSALN